MFTISKGLLPIIAGLRAKEGSEWSSPDWGVLQSLQAC
jgi:hypothetical protein